MSTSSTKQRSLGTGRLLPDEPVFVEAPRAGAENEGVLLAVVFDSGKGNSFLLVLDAASLEGLARAEAPHHIPYGFHGQFAA